jgi:hypothetical protein
MMTYQNFTVSASKDPRSKLRGFQEWSSNKLNCTF